MRLSLSVALLLTVVPYAAAQQPIPYDGIQAGLDSYQLAEERRRGAIDDQLWLNDEMRARAGIPTSRGETIYYGNGPAGGYVPADRDYAYTYVRRGLFGRVRGVVVVPRTVFEPWPVVAGDIYGYQYERPVRQPIGQHQEQTGPNRWESHPVYDPPLPNYRPLPPVVEDEIGVETTEPVIVEGGQSREIVETLPPPTVSGDVAPPPPPAALQPLKDEPLIEAPPPVKPRRRPREF